MTMDGCRPFNFYFNGSKHHRPKKTAFGNFRKIFSILLQLWWERFATLVGMLCNFGGKGNSSPPKRYTKKYFAENILIYC
jgi:hypothetical protein